MEQKKVLVITGGLVSARDGSLWSLLKKQVAQFRHSEEQWLELKIKSIFSETALTLESARRRILRKGVGHPLYEFLSKEVNVETPDLTEVTLMTLLAQNGLEPVPCSVDQIFGDPEAAGKLMADIPIVFLSSTLLRDLSELKVILDRVRRPNQHLILGGALVGTLYHQWNGMPEVEVVAIGYGEYLIPSLADWIRGGFGELTAPATGRVEKREHSLFLFSGVPASLNLDFLPKPDWRAAEKIMGRKFRAISYESVRGCPYRCAFCNYPYLFDDKKFRYKSAEKMAQDWREYSEEMDVQYMTCLDSLFTMPKKRLIDFCERLIAQGNRIQWICYARADDLNDEEVVKLLLRAGAIQVQIGIESGDQRILDNMNKRVTVETNHRALENCRKHGLTAVATFIVGFPGEDERSMENTFQFMRETPPDFYFLATFSTRVMGVPILQPDAREKFGLNTRNVDHTISPYWYHDSMDCLQATRYSRWLNDRIITEKLSLEGNLLYKNILGFKPDLRDDLLEFQYQAWKKARGVHWVFSNVNRYLDRKLGADLDNFRKGAFVS